MAGQTMARRTAEPGVNLALPLQGAGPPVHLDAKERRNEYAARAVIGPPRPRRRRTIIFQTGSCNQGLIH